MSTCASMLGMISIYEIVLGFFLLVALGVVAATVIVGSILLIHRVTRRGRPPMIVGSPGTSASATVGAVHIRGGNCPRCGTVLGTDSPHGLCPKCLLDVGLGTQPGADSPGLAGREGPALDPSALAPHFPNFEILDLIAQGGMGWVYKARQKNLDRVVALKVLPPDIARDPAFAERFHREARTLASLSHPNIVTVYDYGETSGWFYLVMEYVDGADLRRVLQERKLTPAEALRLVPAICEALQYAHTQGVVHRDIKPGNILLDREGRVKIADFGIAKLLRKDLSGVTLTESRQSIGTVHYMAPEQTENPESVDHRADIYSLGVVLYEMLTGELPLGRFAPPSRKVEVDVRLDEVVLRALEKEPARRYQEARAVKTDLEQIQGSPGTGAAPGGAGWVGDISGSTVAGHDWALIAGLLWALLFIVFVGQTILLSGGSALSDLGVLTPVLAVLSMIGVAAPLGTTGLAMVSLSGMRRRSAQPSESRFKLALASVCFFPVLTMAAVAWLFLALIVGIAIRSTGQHGVSDSIAIPGLAAISLALILVVSRLIVPALRRAARAFINPPFREQPAWQWWAWTSALTGLAVLGFAMSAFTQWITMRGAARMANTMQRPVRVRLHRNVVPTKLPPGLLDAMTWLTPAGAPVITPEFADGVLALSPSGLTSLNGALADAYQEYLEHLRQNLTRVTNTADGQVNIRVAPFTDALEEVENEFWAAADRVLDERQQQWLRLNLPVRTPAFTGPIDPGVGVHLPRRLFDFGTAPLELEYREADGWYRWRVYDPALFPDWEPPKDSHSAISRELPERYRLLLDSTPKARQRPWGAVQGK